MRPALAQTTDAKEQWYRWGKLLTSTRNYLGSNGNPYRSLTVTVTYTVLQCLSASGCSNFSGYGFWDGGSTFKIRSAFPAGRWLWEVSCTGSSNGVSCADDPIFTYPGNYGVVEVADDYPVEPDLLERGFPKISGSDLVYGDGAMKFFWQADTAWLANGVDHNRDDRWSSYLADRRLRGFSVVLLDPWAGGAPDSATAGHILFDDLGFGPSFGQRGDLFALVR